MTLKFARGNAKLGKEVYTFSLLSGHTCPFAEQCLSKAVPDENGIPRIQDGKKTVFRCFSASQEVIFPTVYTARKHNTDLLRGCKGTAEIVKLIESSLPAKAKVVRVHVAGDFFNQRYFDAWCHVAERNPDRLFYAYTKALPFWTKRLGQIPTNFVLTASYGGRRDDMIQTHNLRFAKVIFSEREGLDLGLETDHDDSLAMKQGPSFALLLHGIQPKGTDAAKALRELNGKGSYPRKQK